MKRALFAIAVLQTCCAAFAATGCGSNAGPARHVASCRTREPRGFYAEELTNAQVMACQKRFKLSLRKIIALGPWDRCPSTLPPGAATTCDATVDRMCLRAVKRGRFRETDDCLYHDQNAPGRHAIPGAGFSIYTPPDWQFTYDKLEPEGDISDRTRVGRLNFFPVPTPVYEPRAQKFRPFAGDFVSFLGEHPYLRVDAVRRTRLGRLAVIEIAITGVQNDPRALSNDLCGSDTMSTHPSPCIPIAGGVTSDRDVPITLSAGGTTCLADVRATPTQRLLVVVSPSRGSAAAACKAAEPLLQTLDPQ